MTMDLQTLRQSIDTIFIVMLENRSFDHVFGHRFGIPAITNPSSRDASRTYNPQLVRDQWIDTDLPHGRDKIATSLEAGMRGFVHAYEDELGATCPANYCPPMWNIDRQDLPITNFLADNFRVCKRWHAALPCDTFPNRLMAMSGTSLIDDTSGVNPVSNKWLPDQYTVHEWATNTIKDRPPFHVYVDWHSIPGIGYPSSFYLMKRLHPYLSGRQSNLADLAGDIATWEPGKAPAIVYCEPFFNDLAIRIPVVSLHGNCNHAPLPMTYGEGLLSRVYAAITSRPEIWKRSLMIVYYDEHGGFFDHVQPPQLTTSFPPPVGSRWIWNNPIKTLGLRVPAILVSPFSDASLTAADSTSDLLFDHTSVIQLLVERFGAPGDLSRFGEAQARSSQVRSVREALGSVASNAAPPAAPNPPPDIPKPDLVGSHEATSQGANIWASHLDD
jgi:phospholipase C